MMINKIDELTEGDHYYINAKSECYYFVECPTGGIAENKNNPNYSWVSNFKKTKDREDKPEWKYKIHAINKTIDIFKDFLTRNNIFENYTLIPIPPSKIRSNDLYDDRMTQVLLGASENEENADVRDILICKTNLISHTQEVRPSIKELHDNYELDPSLIDGIRNKIILFDDVLTSGAHFCAASQKLREINPNFIIKGVFISRRVLPTAKEDFSFLFQ